MVVDSVSEVVSIFQKDIKDPLTIGKCTTDVDLISGIAQIKDGARILLNIDNVFA
jgi:chemotaxis signal transduction protein